MYLIVLHHACVHTNAALPSGLLSDGGIIVAAVLSIGGKLGVNLFVMTTGYFMVKSRFRVKSFLKVLLQAVFYAVTIVVVFYLLDPQGITWERAVGLTALLAANPDTTEALGITVRYFSGNYSAFLLLAGIGMFLAFGQLRMPASRLVNGIASTTFGIYLIHDNAIMRPWLWAHFGAVFELRALLLAPALLALALCVFAVCGAIDYIRQLLARLLAVRPAQERLAVLYAKIDRWFDLNA